MKLTAGQLKEMSRENLKWPVDLTPVSQEQWEQVDRSVMAKSGSFDDVIIAVWRSRRFLVQVYQQYSYGDIIRLSVQTTDYDNKIRRFKDGISWDSMQAIKAEVGYGDYCGLEVFPPDNLVVNVANVRHMFILPKGQIPSFVWTNKGS